MGFYIFDSHEVGPGGKLAMLEKLPGAARLDEAPASVEQVKYRGCHVVCWVDNSIFEAVAIVYDDQELRRFVEGMEGRPHRWYLVPTEELVKLRPHLVEYLRGERNWRD